MKTIGSALREAREARGETLEEIAGRTRIRAEFLASIEREEFDALPKGPFAQGFIRTYARELGLNPENAAAIYRRDFGRRTGAQLLPTGVIAPIRKRTWLSVTPQVIGGIFLALVVAVFLLLQVRALNQPPPLIVSQPTEKQEVRSPVVVQGQTATDCVVSVNGADVAVDQDGNFTANVNFPTGPQTITVDSTNRKGKTRVVQRSVNVVE
jgi:cytoskeleton protein RodZ